VKEISRMRLRKEVKMGKRFLLAGMGILILLYALPVAAGQQVASHAQVGTSFPADFPVIRNYYLGVPVIGFGSDRGHITKVPVILQGNNDTPFPTACNP
jgi:hypothetical protein